MNRIEIYTTELILLLCFEINKFITSEYIFYREIMQPFDNCELNFHLSVYFGDKIIYIGKNLRPLVKYKFMFGRTQIPTNAKFSRNKVDECPLNYMPKQFRVTQFAIAMLCSVQYTRGVHTQHNSCLVERYLITDISARPRTTTTFNKQHSTRFYRRRENIIPNERTNKLANQKLTRIIKQNCNLIYNCVFNSQVKSLDLTDLNTNSTPIY